MDFVLALHSHLPYVLNHGRWPHGSDWLSEATIDSYLPLLEVLYRWRDEGTSAPVTIGFTPVLAAQLADPDFPAVLESYFDQRDAACVDAPRTLAASAEIVMRRPARRSARRPRRTAATGWRSSSAATPSTGPRKARAPRGSACSAARSSC